jgi:hypothetical protein
VDHPVAVAAEQGQVADSCFTFTSHVKRLNVMAFDITLPPIAVGLLEVEPARLAGQRIAAVQDTPDLLAA